MSRPYTNQTFTEPVDDTLLNAQLAEIKAALDRMLSRYGDTPNEMNGVLDMNSNRLYNLPAPTTNTEPVRLADLPSGTATTAASLVTVADAGGYFASANVEGALQEAGAAAVSDDARLDAIEANNWVTTVRINNSAVTTAKIADANVTTAKLADNLITPVKLASAAASAGYSMLNGTLVVSAAGNALTVALKTLAGTDPSATDPVYMIFRSATASDGSYVVRAVTAALSFTLSNGSTIGATNATAFRGWVVAFDDAAVVRLGVINCLVTSAGSGAGRNADSIYPLAQFALASSTAEGGAGAADSAQTFYTGTAVTNKAYTTLGYFTFETGLATAGVYSAGPTRVELFHRGCPLPGHIVQTQRSATGAVATGTTVMPDDDTIPQITEGDQYMTQSITPTSAANALKIETSTCISSSAVSVTQVALFQDATANALIATREESGGAAGSNQVTHKLFHALLAATTASTTLRIRAGTSSGTNTFNGRASARKLGGVLNSFMQVEEVMA